MSSATLPGQPAAGDRYDIRRDDRLAQGRSVPDDDPRQAPRAMGTTWEAPPEAAEVGGHPNLSVSSWYAISGTAMA